MHEKRKFDELSSLIERAAEEKTKAWNNVFDREASGESAKSRTDFPYTAHASRAVSDRGAAGWFLVAWSLTPAVSKCGLEDPHSMVPDFNDQIEEVRPVDAGVNMKIRTSSIGTYFSFRVGGKPAAQVIFVPDQEDTVRDVVDANGAEEGSADEIFSCPSSLLGPDPEDSSASSLRYTPPSLFGGSNHDYGALKSAPPSWDPFGFRGAAAASSFSLSLFNPASTPAASSIFGAAPTASSILFSAGAEAVSKTSSNIFGTTGTEGAIFQPPGAAPSEKQRRFVFPSSEARQEVLDVLGGFSSASPLLHTDNRGRLTSSVQWVTDNRVQRRDVEALVLRLCQERPRPASDLNLWFWNKVHEDILDSSKIRT